MEVEFGTVWQDDFLNVVSDKVVFVKCHVWRKYGKVGGSFQFQRGFGHDETNCWSTVPPEIRPS